jgi:hypothetical protein
MQTTHTDTPIFDALGGEQRIRQINTDYLIERHNLLQTISVTMRKTFRPPNARQRKAIAKQMGWE